MNEDQSKPKRQNAYRDAHRRKRFLLPQAQCDAMHFEARGGRSLDHSSRVGTKLKIAIAIVACSPAFGCSY